MFFIFYLKDMKKCLRYGEETSFRRSTTRRRPVNKKLLDHRGRRDINRGPYESSCFPKLVGNPEHGKHGVLWTYTSVGIRKPRVKPRI
jgi:hypothetical protein